MSDDLKQKILDRIEVDENGCWLWTGFSRSGGYGDLHHLGRIQRAHRLSYEAFVGPIPGDLTLDHLCRVRRCVNPEHLEPVTGRENTLRGESFAARYAKQTRCKHGHEYTPENTIRRYDGGRGCRICQRRYGREAMKRRWVADRSDAPMTPRATE
jgi:hypothetical protein